MKKSERLPIIKQKMAELKNTLREQLSKLKVSSFEFDINGNTIEARLYDTGIREVLEKLTQEKAGMLSLSKEIFENSEYLYSTQDKSGDTNIEAWDYFYVPIKIGDETAGVRIAVRTVSNPKESQIYNWSIKKDTSLGGVRHTPFGSNPNGTSSDVSAKTIPQNGNGVNTSSEKSSIETQSLEEYLGERGLSSPVSNYNIDKTRIPHGETQRQRDARIKAGMKAENEYSEKRRAAIEEYNAKVEKGEIRVPSAIEKTIKKAQGYLDNPSVAAARRMAEKRGYDWISGEKLDAERQVYTLSYLDENGKELSETFTTRGEAEERAATLSENAGYDTKALVTATMPQNAAQTQQSSENAAQTQRAETEEEARLRTLYESEPEGTEAAAKTSREAPGTVSFEQMYGTKPPDGTENQSFEEWAAGKDAEKKKAAEGANHIKEQIRENQELLNTKKVAASVNVPLESVNDKRNIREWATSTLASSGYKAFNPELGTVIFDGQRINGAVKYLQTKAEFAAFAALPDVIAKGSVLAVHENHKGRDYGTYTIIAPIEINGQRGNMAVVVKKTSDNFYKVHRILAPDGRKLDIPDIKNSESTLRRGHTENDGAHANSIGSESNKSIPQNGNAVNTSDTNPFENTESKAALDAKKSIGEDIGQKAQELIDETKKRKADAEVTDEKLKGMSTKRQDEVLKERAEKAGIDMTPEELVDFAQSIGRIKGLFGGEFKDFARILDDASGRSEAIRNTLHKLFERPFRKAQSQYTQNYKRAVEHISKKFSELGIKAGSKESAAVQRYGEGVYQVSKNGETKPYTEEMLKRDFPDSWEKIAEAAKYSRTVYDYYLKNLNEMYEKIYPNTLEKAEAYKNKVREKSVREFKKAGQLGKYARGLETNLMCGLLFILK